MNWEAISAISETVGSIAVVASLAYRAVQIRRSTRESQRSVYFAIRSQVQQFRTLLAEDPEVARIYREGLTHLGDLGDDDRWRFGALMQYEFNLLEDLFRLRGEAPLFHDNGEDLRWRARRPGAREWWHKGKRLYHPDCQRHVDALIAGRELRPATASQGLSPAAQQDAAVDEPQRGPIGSWYRLASDSGASTGPQRRCDSQLSVEPLGGMGQWATATASNAIWNDVEPTRAVLVEGGMQVEGR